MQIKRFNVEGAALLGLFYDVQNMVNGDSQVTFFPRVSTATAITGQNYEQQPFAPLTKDHTILAIGFEPVLPWVQEATNINVNNVAQAVMSGAVQLEIGNRVIVKKLTMPQVADFSKCQAWSEVKYASAAFDSSVQNFFWPGSDLIKLDSPLKVPAGEVLGVTLNLNTTFTLPTAAHWTTAAQGGTYGLRCVLQYTRDKLPEELTPLDRR